MRRVTLALMLALSVAGCGQKGDLHMPDDNDDQAAADTETS